MKQYFVLLITLFNSCYGTLYVTNGAHNGRLGDQLIHYAHAKWFAYKYGIKFLLTPFEYAKFLALYDIEEKIITKFKDSDTLKYNQNSNEFFQQNSFRENFLYIIPYFPENLEEHKPPKANPLNQTKNYKFAYFKVDWKDLDFKQSLQNLIKPKNNLNTITPPVGFISIAVHIRKNCEGFDLPFLNGLSLSRIKRGQQFFDILFPLKCPPEDYYITQINRIIDIYKNNKFFIYIFTDDSKPKNIVFQIKKKINASNNITFGCRDTNKYANTFWEDLFSMLNFDCLIHSHSNYSLIISKIGDFKISVAPTDYTWKGTKLIVTETEFNLDENVKFKRLKEYE